MSLKLTQAEITHLLTLIYWNNLNGTYYGNRAHYVKRSNRIRAKIEKLKQK